MEQSPKRGFRLIEVLVTLFIIVILVGFLFPPVRKVRDAAARSHCCNNIKNLMIGLHTAASMESRDSSSSEKSQERLKNEWFPTGCIGPGDVPEERLSWLYQILPHSEQQNVFEQFVLDQGYNGNLKHAETSIKFLLCPDPNRKNQPQWVTNYVAISGIGDGSPTRPAGAEGNGFIGYDRRTSFAMIEDGTSNTIAIMETRRDLGPWARGGFATVRGFDPNATPLFGDDRPFGVHGKVTNVGMCDGSVRSVPVKIDPKRFADAITIAGGEGINLD